MSFASPRRPARPGNDFVLAEFRTRRGTRLAPVIIRYRIFGAPARRSGASWIVVFHDLTGSADLDRWWGPLLGPGRPLDTSRYPVLAADLLGSDAVGAGPGEWARRGGRVPDLSPADLAGVWEPLLDHLGIERIGLAVGPALGGMVALEWARRTSRRVDHLMAIATPAVSSPQAIAWHTAERMAIEADPAWQQGRYPPGRGPDAGLAAARALALVTEASNPALAGRFARMGERTDGHFAVEQFLRRRGRAQIAELDARSYLTLLRAMDLHDLGDLSEAARATARIAGRITGVGINTDMLVLPAEVKQWIQAYRAAGAPAEYREITSIYGHEAYRREYDQLAPLLQLPPGRPAG